MNAYKILLHIGLPKTATTSLQNNVLMPLHRQQKINFLGKFDCYGGDYSYQYFPIYKFLQQLNNTKLSIKAAAELKSMLEQDLLVKNKLNVISAEELLNAHLHKQDVIFYNLQQLFKHYEVVVLMSLRAQMDFLSSHYAEFYYWHYHQFKQYNSFDKFVKQLLHNPAEDKYKTYFYDKLLGSVSLYFSNIRVLLFEDLQQDKVSYFGLLADSLQLNLQPADIEKMFFYQRHNISNKGSDYIYSKRITIGHYFARYAKMMASHRYAFLLKSNKIGGGVITFLRKIYAIKLSAKKHKYPNAKIEKKLRKILCIKDKNFAKNYHLDRQKLKNYCYLIDSD